MLNFRGVITFHPTFHSHHWRILQLESGKPICQSRPPGTVKGWKLLQEKYIILVTSRKCVPKKSYERGGCSKCPCASPKKKKCGEDCKKHTTFCPCFKQTKKTKTSPYLIPKSFPQGFFSNKNSLSVANGGKGKKVHRQPLGGSSQLVSS